MTKDEFLEIKNKHSYENQYKIKDKNELKELVKLAESIDVNMDLNWLDVSNVTDMSFMFYDSKFNGDISKWDVSNVTSMCCMFYNSKFNGDISKWDVSNVTDMESMFANSKFNGDISKWDVSNVTNMESMFVNSKFNGDISKWDVSNVTNMKVMFANSKFTGYLGGWDVSNVTNADNFNPYLNINDLSELRNYMSFLNSIYNNKPVKTDVKKEWLKTDGIHLYIADRMNRDREFTDNIKKILCT